MDNHGTPEQFSFIKTPLEFFGHSSDDIHFGYPAAYYDQMAEAETETTAGLERLRQEHLEAVEKKKQLPDQYVPLASETEYKDYVAYERRIHTGSVKQEWYERRFRGRYASYAAERHPDTANYFSWSYKGLVGPPPPVPASEAITTYLNDMIVFNEWQGAYGVVRKWYEGLGEDDPQREVAKNYAGFSGDLILNQYCRIALTLASDSLADDDFVSTKHLFTVCLPMAHELEPFIPQEAQRTKQLLREVFMEYALRSGNTVRRYAELFGSIVLGHEMTSLEQRDVNEDEALSFLMRYDETEKLDKEQMISHLIELSQRLEDQQEWARAIDVLDLSRYAFDIPTERLQPRIDELAINAVLYYTADMSKLDESWSYQQGAYTHWTDNGQQISEIRMSQGMSNEAHKKLNEIETIRGLEYTIQQLDSSGVNTNEQAVMEDLFAKLAGASSEIAARFGAGETQERLMKFLSDPAVLQVSASGFDEMTSNIIRLSNKNVFSTEQQNSILANLMDGLIEETKKPARYEQPFERFIGLISPIMRGTRPAENPGDEMLWALIPKGQFVELMDAVIQHARLSYPADVAYLDSFKEAFLADCRRAWGDYWDEAEEYSW